ncbi:SIP domain-containing protein [Streptomyces sp. SID5475]|nr:SIP domain-containing protein [Streptomyces sp. SID5475]
MREPNREQSSARASRRPLRYIAKNRRVLEATVRRTERVTPSMVKVTIWGPELAQFHALGGDQMFRLFFRRSGQSTLRLPAQGNGGWMRAYALMSGASRPYTRFYTVRAYRPEALEMDIEFVVHGDAAPASGWALRAEPGEQVGIYDEGATFLPRPVDGWQLLVGDESALPAILAILDGAPADMRAHVFLEVPHASDIRRVAVPDGVELHWLPREDDEAVPGKLALRTLTSTALPAQNPSEAFLAGESSLATGGRRYLVNERGMPKSAVRFLGYWKHGRASP